MQPVHQNERIPQPFPFRNPAEKAQDPRDPHYHAELHVQLHPLDFRFRRGGSPSTAGVRAVFSLLTAIVPLVLVLLVTVKNPLRVPTLAQDGLRGPAEKEDIQRDQDDGGEREKQEERDPLTNPAEVVVPVKRPD